MNITGKHRTPESASSLALKWKRLSFLDSVFSIVYTCIATCVIDPLSMQKTLTCSWAGCLRRMGRQSTGDRWKENSCPQEAQPETLHGAREPPSCSHKDIPMSSDLNWFESRQFLKSQSTTKHSAFSACCKHQIKVYQVTRLSSWQMANTYLK